MKKLFYLKAHIFRILNELREFERLYFYFAHCHFD